MPIWLKIAGQIIGSKLLENKENQNILQTSLGILNNAKRGIK